VKWCAVKLVDVQVEARMWLCRGSRVDDERQTNHTERVSASPFHTRPMTSTLSKRAVNLQCRRLVSRNNSSLASTRTKVSSPSSRIVFSGIQPTGIPHLGNYLGALQGWVHLQNTVKDDDTLIYSLVDLHAITVKQDPAQLKQWKKESLAALLAVGLDPKRSTIFFQSNVC
jgi:tryptophanyl-tRNA synthetase